jgi:hypothetical protein
MYAVALELFQITVTAFQDFRMIYLQIWLQIKILFICLYF